MASADFPEGWASMMTFISERFSNYERFQNEMLGRVRAMEEAQFAFRNSVDEALLFIRNTKFDADARERLNARMEELTTAILPVFKEQVTGLVTVIGRDMEDLRQWRVEFARGVERWQRELHEELEVALDKVATGTGDSLSALRNDLRTLDTRWSTADAGVQTTRITVRGQVLIALIGALGGGSGLVALLITLASK